MRKGFTLLELMIVIIIVGVLATLAISQYSVLVEKSRAAEAKQVIGRIRGACAAIYMENGSTVGCDNAALKIGVPATAGIEIPGVAAANCASSNWFWYSAAVVGTTGVTVTATRCLANGKTPNASGTAGTVVDAIVYTIGGGDTWSTTAPY